MARRKATGPIIGLVLLDNKNMTVAKVRLEDYNGRLVPLCDSSNRVVYQKTKMNARKTWAASETKKWNGS
jgi:hypothetical protein